MKNVSNEHEMMMFIFHHKIYLYENLRESELMA